MRIAFDEAAAIYSPSVDASMTFSCDFNDRDREEAVIGELIRSRDLPGINEIGLEKKPKTTFGKLPMWRHTSLLS